MILWIAFACLTAVAALAILYPFWRERMDPAAAPRDIEVYKQQLQEIEDEAASGLLGKAQAEAARIEVSRRILAEDALDAKVKRPASVRSALAPYVFAALLPAISLSLYIAYGSPGLPGYPLASREADDMKALQQMVAQVEERLRAKPDDGTGWNVIAPIYMRLERYADAADAYRKASRLLGENAERSADLGEALTLAKNGIIDPEARQAFEKSLALDPEQTKASFWLGVAEEQNGQFAKAAAIFAKLLDRDLPEAVETILREKVAALQSRLTGITPQQQPEPEVDAARIDQMVSGLAERLKQDGSDLNGWLMLVRAYSVLGRQDDAVTALKDARSQFAGNTDALGQIDALAKSLGLPS